MGANAVTAFKSPKRTVRELLSGNAGSQKLGRLGRHKTLLVHSSWYGVEVDGGLSVIILTKVGVRCVCTPSEWAE